MDQSTTDLKQPSVCDRCRDAAPVVSCLACGGSNLEVMRFCAECDAVVHQIVYKQSHVRTKLSGQQSQQTLGTSPTAQNPYLQSLSQQRLIPREEPIRRNDVSYKQL